MLPVIFSLLVIYQIKHWLCDYPWQTPYMLKKFETGTKWIKPLAAHAGVHGLSTFVIAFLFSCFNNISMPLYFCMKLAVLDFSIHFIQDRIKASPNILGRWKPDQPYFWWSLGQDQAVHHLTHYYIIYELVGGLIYMC